MKRYQLVILSAIFAAATATVTPWNGPLADHKIGELVQETPEVANARRIHEEAFAKIQSRLPKLPEEEENDNGYVNTPVHIPHFPVTSAPLIHHVQPVTHFPQVDGARIPWTGPIAEHRLGEPVRETPEVAAARKHHQDIFQRVRSALPELRDENREVHHHVIPQVHRGEDVQVRALMERIAYLQNLLVQTTTVSPFHHQSQFPVDTPEVAAAKLEHARAVAAVLGH